MNVPTSDSSKKPPPTDVDGKDKLIHDLLARVEKLTKDRVTGYQNLVIFHEKLEQIQKENIPYGYIKLDVDRFKETNKKDGEKNGDRILRQVADAIQASFPDNFGKGGDEFYIVMPHCNSVEETAARADSLRESIQYKKIFVLNKEGKPEQRPVTISVGVAFFDPALSPDASENKVEVCADLALDEAKGWGRVVTPNHGNACYYMKDGKPRTFEKANLQTNVRESKQDRGVEFDPHVVARMVLNQLKQKYREGIDPLFLEGKNDAQLKEIENCISFAAAEIQGGARGWMRKGDRVGISSPALMPANPGEEQKTVMYYDGEPEIIREVQQLYFDLHEADVDPNNSEREFFLDAMKTGADLLESCCGCKDVARGINSFVSFQKRNVLGLHRLGRFDRALRRSRKLLEPKY